MTRIWWILFWALKSLKNVHFDWCAKHTTFDLKKVQWSYISWHWRVVQNLKKNWLVVWKWHEEFAKFSPEHMKFSKLGLSLDPLIQSRKCVSLKLKGELCVMRMKNDAKFETELTCHLKIDMRNFNGLILIKAEAANRICKCGGGGDKHRDEYFHSTDR